MALTKFCLFFILHIIIQSKGDQLANKYKDVRIKSVERVIDISSQLVKIHAQITLENAGSSPVNEFVLAEEPSWRNKLAYIGIKDSHTKELKLTSFVEATNKVKYWRADLKETLKPGSTVTLAVDVVLTNYLEPYPTAITQQEDQLVKFMGNINFYCPYKIVQQKVKFMLNTKHVESYTKLKPFSVVDDGIEYGPHVDIAPLTNKEVSIHYKNNSPFLTVSRIERLIEVSHWGNIAVEEVVEISHSGAKLKGSFSRYDYQQDHSSGPASVRSYKTLLPASASDVYYRDSNGNISTSNMKVKKDLVELDLRPRYPLFGGWRTHYTLGYNVPSYEYLYHSNDQYLLKMRAIDHIFNDMQVSEVITKVILPEGATKIKLSTPYPVIREADSLHYTYLDTTGRPVITFKKTNVVEHHIQDFQIRYAFPRILMLQEPLLVVGFLYALFLCVIIYVRLDFSIHKSEHHKE